MTCGISSPGLALSGFMRAVDAFPAAKGRLGIFWLGQAGFLLKAPGGALIAVDPYLSDACERIVGFTRLTPPVMPLDEFRADYLFISHAHPDHFDADLVGSLKRGAAPGIYGAPDCAVPACEAGLPQGGFHVLREGERLDFGGFSVLPVKADHGALAPDALGFIFDFGFVRVYFAGDTAYSPGVLKKAYELRPEVALLPINGEYGNMGAADAARLAAGIGARVLIPCHFWTFAEHGSNPIELLRIADSDLPGCRLVFLPQGGCYSYQGDGADGGVWDRKPLGCFSCV